MGIKITTGIALLAGLASTGAAAPPMETVAITNDMILARDYSATPFIIRGDTTNSISARRGRLSTGRLL